MFFLFQKPTDVSTNTNPCSNCENLRKDKKKLQRKLRELTQKMKENQDEWAKTFHELSQSPLKSKVSTCTGKTDVH